MNRRILGVIVLVWMALLSGLATARQFEVADYGAVKNGSTNDADALQAAVNAAQTNGGGYVTLTPGTYAIASTIAISKSNVGFYCASGGSFGHDIAVAATGCTLKWTGSSGGTIASIITPTGSPRLGALTGSSFVGVTFDGNNGLAANGLVIKTLRNGTFSSLAFKNFNGGVALDLNVVHSTSSTLGENCDSQFNYFSNISISGYTSTSVPLKLGAWLDGSLTNRGCNASLNTFVNTDIATSATNTAIYMDGADNNTLIRTRLFAIKAGAGYGVDLNIRFDGEVSYPSNSNVFYDLSTTNPVIARGRTRHPACTTAFTNAPSFGACTFGNRFYGIDTGNGSPNPIIEAAAQLIGDFTNGWSIGKLGGTLALADNATSAIASRGTMGTQTLHVYNGASNHIQLQDAANVWGFNINGNTGNLRLNRVSGSGSSVEAPAITTPAINATMTIQANGTPGLSITKTVRNSSGTGTCTLIFTSGLLTGGSC